jgi:hypothetical protein
MEITVEHVRLMPAQLAPGVLYVSREFETATHLCACGCGSKVVTPLGETDWTHWMSPSGPSLFPSVGNWQLPCRSHYWIWNGGIEWAEEWSDEQVKEGREREMARTQAYFRAQDAKVSRRFSKWFSSLFR